MTKRIVASLILLIMVLFAAWYGYQEYKKSQQNNESVIVKTQ